MPLTDNPQHKEIAGVETLEWITYEQAEKENDELLRRLVSEFLAECNVSVSEGKELVANEEQAHLETLFSQSWTGGTTRTAY